MARTPANGSVVPEPEVALPPVVYVPAQLPAPGEAEVVLELRRLQDGRVALLAFSAMDRLVASCGEAQPWALVQTSRLDDLREQGGGWDVVLLDPFLPEDLRHPEPALHDPGGSHEP